MHYLSEFFPFLRALGILRTLEVKTIAAIVLVLLGINSTNKYWGKYLITKVKFGSNLNAMAPKNPGGKLECRHSICVDTVVRYIFWTQMYTI